MQLVFFEPHKLWYKTTVSNFVERTKCVDKYEHLFDYEYKHNDSVYVFVAGHIEALRFYSWVLLNGMKPSRFRVVSALSDLGPEHVLLMFVYGTFSNLIGILSEAQQQFIGALSTVRAYKVVHLSHYAYNAPVAARATRQAGVDLFISENNLTKNSPFFRTYFDWYQRDVYVLPFVPQGRFRRRTQHSERTCKALAVGTITWPMKDEAFASFFGHNQLQPMRELIFTNADALSQQIDSQISRLTPPPNPEAGGISGRTPILTSRGYAAARHVTQRVRTASIVFAGIASARFRKRWQRLGKNERDYYKRDIVTLLNTYTMFVCPEEAVNLPGIGFVEGMACGTAFIGTNDPMYADLGMRDKEHFIAYDGSLEDLLEKVSYYQEHRGELENIAERGRLFVEDHFRGEDVCSAFAEYIRARIGSGRQDSEQSRH